VHENILCCLLGLVLIYLYYWTAIFYMCKIFGHPNYSYCNAKKFMELTRSNLFLVLFLWNIL
jgi:hypothetical protein